MQQNQDSQEPAFIEDRENTILYVQKGQEETFPPLPTPAANLTVHEVFDDFPDSHTINNRDGLGSAKDLMEGGSPPPVQKAKSTKTLSAKSKPSAAVNSSLKAPPKIIIMKKVIAPSIYKDKVPCQFNAPIEIIDNEIKPLHEKFIHPYRDLKKTKHLGHGGEIEAIIDLIYATKERERELKRRDDLEFAVKKLQESLDEGDQQEHQQHHHQKHLRNDTSHNKPITSDHGPLSPETFSEDLIPRTAATARTNARLLMTGQKVQPSRPGTLMPKTPREIYTRPTEPANLLPVPQKGKIIGYKERALLETMAAIGITRMLKVGSQYEHHALQMARYQLKQLHVTRTKVDATLTKLVTNDRRQHLHPNYSNPVGYKKGQVLPFKIALPKPKPIPPPKKISTLKFRQI